VVKGDTLGKIAKQHSVTVQELRQWNSMQGDLIEVDQALVVGVANWPTFSRDSAEISPTPTPDQQKIRKRKSGGPATQEGTADFPPLVMPREKNCLAGPDGSALNEDEQMMASQGLSRQQVRQSMHAFFPQLARCIEGDWPSGTVMLDMNVACSGRVSSIRVDNDGGLEPTLVNCLQQTLSYTPFPAHQLPDGMDFQYPVLFSQ